MIRDTVSLGGRDYGYSEWSGEVVEGPIAFDTETELIEGHTIPRMSVMTASNGVDSYLIPPDRVGEFVEHHKRCVWVAHNAAFDFWVLQHQSRSDQLWKIADRGRLYDTMILDSLYRLACWDSAPVPRNLGVLAKEYCGVTDIDKGDTWRLRYGELIGVPLNEWPIGAREYAIKDALITMRVFRRLHSLAFNRAVASGVDRTTIHRWGPYSIGIQTRAAIAFSRIEQLGIALDPERIEDTQSSIRDRLSTTVGEIEAIPEASELFSKNKSGEYQKTKGGAYRLSTKTLRSILSNVADEIYRDSGIRVDVPTTKTGEISASVPEWSDYVERHPFLSQWSDLQELSKLLQFFGRLEGSDRVHPRYSTLVRTGRASCTSPNLQQIPRASGMRELFRASKGFLLLQTDYSFIELRTLAAVCESRYGFSALADVIRTGVDPHVYTAALVNGMEVSEFLDLKRSDPERFSEERQSAKAVNFGIPGGLGPRNLARYARRTYGVDMDVDQAADLRTKIITEVYPELQEYLSEDSWSIFARSLRCSRRELVRWLCRDGDENPAIIGAVRKIVSGNPFKADGNPYEEEWVESVWKALRYLNQNDELKEPLEMQSGGPELVRSIAYSPVSTLTGRVRGRVSYSQARNTPFQGLAADGAKLALFRLVRDGFRVVGFVHDEILVELPDQGGYVDRCLVTQVEQTMIEEMQRVCPLPIAVESSLSPVWSKSAGIVFEDEKCLPG